MPSSIIIITTSVVLLLLSVCRQTSSWMLQQQQTKTRIVHPLPAPSITSSTSSSSIYSHATPGIFYQEDSDPADCPDEEECEINWDLMPGYNDNDDDEKEKEKVTVDEEKEETQSSSSSYSSTLYSSSSYSSYVRPVQPVKPRQGRSRPRSIEKSRVFLEMNWQIEECVVDADTLTDFCSDCAGSGYQWCNFCRGTRMISFIGNGNGDSDDSEFRTCLICRTDGHIDCSTCAGTGNISPWAATYDKQKEQGLYGTTQLF